MCKCSIMFKMAPQIYMFTNLHYSIDIAEYFLGDFYFLDLKYSRLYYSEMRAQQLLSDPSVCCYSESQYNLV